MNKHKNFSILLPFNVILVLFLSSLLRILIWNTSPVSELLSRTLSFALAAVLLFLVKKFKSVNTPILQVAVLYCLAFILLVYEKLFPSPTQITRYLAGIPLSLTVCPILATQRHSGQPFIATLGLIPAYVLLLISGADSVVFVLCCLHLLLLMFACAKDWFGEGGANSFLSVYCVLVVTVLTWMVCFNGSAFLADALFLRLSPEMDWTEAGYWDYLTRSVIRHASLFPSDAGINALYAPVGTPYLIAQTLHSYGWIAALAPAMLLVVLSLMLFLESHSFWQLGFSLATAIPTALALSQNLGFHLVYVDIPFVSSDVVGTSIHLILVALTIFDKQFPLFSPDFSLSESKSPSFMVETLSLPDGIEDLKKKLADGYPAFEAFLDGSHVCTLFQYSGLLDQVIDKLEDMVFADSKVIILVKASDTIPFDHLELLAETIGQSLPFADSENLHVKLVRTSDLPLQWVVVSILAVGTARV